MDAQTNGRPNGQLENIIPL